MMRTGQNGCLCNYGGDSPGIVNVSAKRRYTASRNPAHDSYWLVLNRAL
jgi:hypothetical protein